MLRASGLPSALRSGSSVSCATLSSSQHIVAALLQALALAARFGAPISTSHSICLQPSVSE